MKTTLTTARLMSGETIRIAFKNGNRGRIYWRDAEDNPHGEDVIAFHVTEGGDEGLIENVCTPDSAFLDDYLLPLAVSWHWE